MRIELMLKNFRAFTDAHPARLILEPGFTALIGTNNAGKTSLLRFFYEFRPLFNLVSSPQQGGIFQALAGNPFGVSFPGEVTDAEELFSNRNDRDIEIAMTVVLTENDPEPAHPLPSRVKLTVGRATRAAVLTIEPAQATADLSLNGTVLTYRDGTSFELGPYFEAFQTLITAIYIGAFRNAITVGGATYYDVRIGRDFIQAWDAFKAGTIRAQTRAALTVEEDIAKIFGYDDLELNATTGGDHLQAVINGDVYLLHELGAGIAHFILVLAFAAVRSPSLILIDEPESNLHPSLQLSFLTALAAHSRLGVVFATHSVGLARAAAERTYVVRAIRNGESELHELERAPRLSELLGELSFDGYRQLGFDAVLLVEGSTDVKAVRELLRSYGDERKALVMPLGGGQLVRGGVAEQLAELTRISDNVWALVDSERSAEGEAVPENVASFEKECDDVGITCHVLERRALENYFSDRAVKAAFDDNHRGLQPYELLADVSPSWGKPESWRIARELRRDELDGTDLGDFLAEFAAALG